MARTTSKKPLKALASYAFVDKETTPVWNAWGVGGEPDKMKVSDKWTEQVKLARFFYQRDPMAAGVVNKQIELAFNDYRPQMGNCTEEEFTIFNSFNDIVLQGLRLLATEYLISGLLIPETTWLYKTGRQLLLKGHPNKKYYIPESIWLRDPTTIELGKTPIPTKVRILVKIPQEDIYFIKNKGVYSNGTKDKNLYNSFVKDYPEYVTAIKEGKTSIELPDAFSIRRRVPSGSIYPTPYLLPALESLIHKRNLKKMDYSVASRVISAIQLITLGNDEYPLTEDDQQALEDLKAQMRWRNQPNNIERVFQLFGNHTLGVSWISPDVGALLDEAKYNSVNNDILYALGIPGIITTGETRRSATSQAEFALLPPTEVLRSLRDELLPYMKYLYEQVAEKNNFDHIAIPALSPIRLYDPAKLAEIGKTYWEAGKLSGTTWDDLAGFDLDNELNLIKKEQSKIEELGIPTSPQVPFSSPKIGQPSSKPPKETPEKPQ